MSRLLIVLSGFFLLFSCFEKDNTPAPALKIAQTTCIDKNALIGRSFNYIDSPSPPATATLDFLAGDSIILSYTMNSQPAGVYKWKIAFKSNNDSMYWYPDGINGVPGKYKIEILSCDTMRITNSYNSYRLVTK